MSVQSDEDLSDAQPGEQTQQSDAEDDKPTTWKDLVSEPRVNLT